MSRTDHASRIINAAPERIYAAFTDPEQLRKWLPPEGATATIDAFDPAPGGAFCLTLTFADPVGGHGNSSDQTDVVKGWVETLDPNRLIVQSFNFESDDPSFAGTMNMTWRLEAQDGATHVSVTAENVPPGISAADHQQGLNASLANLANLLETPPDGEEV